MSGRNFQPGRGGHNRRVANDWLAQVHAALVKPYSGDALTDDDRVAAIRSRVLGIVTTILVALHRYCPHRAEDLTHDVVVKLLRFDTMRQLDPNKGTIRQWLFGMIRWTVVASLRRDRPSRGGPEEGLDRLPDAGPLPPEHAQQRELAELVQTCIAELTDKRREAVERKFFPKPDAMGHVATNAARERVNRSRGLKDLQRIFEQSM